jgi:RPC5 protein
MPPDSGDHESPTNDSTQVVAEYSVFWKKTAPQKRIFLLQFPSRYSDQPFNLANYNKPSEIRIKPQSGLVEIDVPVHIGRRYDISKGTKFAAALKESRARRSGFLPGKGEYGLAGGFGINAHLHGRATRSSIGRDADGMDLEDGGSDSYLQMLTLGGRLRMFKRGDPIYTIGTFRGGMLLSCNKTVTAFNIGLQMSYIFPRSTGSARYNRSFII